MTWPAHVPKQEGSASGYVNRFFTSLFYPAGLANMDQLR